MSRHKRGSVGFIGRSHPKSDDPISIRQVWDDAILIRYGPLIKAVLDIPNSLKARLQNEKKSIPNPIEGYVLIDTGSDFTSVAEHVVREFNIIPTGTMLTHGVHETKQVLSYYITISIPGKNKVFTMTEEVATANIEFAFINLEREKKIKVLGLLGREFFIDKKLVCDFPNNVVTIVDERIPIKIGK